VLPLETLGIRKRNWRADCFCCQVCVAWNVHVGQWSHIGHAQRPWPSGVGRHHPQPSLRLRAQLQGLYQGICFHNLFCSLWFYVFNFYVRKWWWLNHTIARQPMSLDTLCKGHFVNHNRNILIGRFMTLKDFQKWTNNTCVPVHLLFLLCVNARRVLSEDCQNSLETTLPLSLAQQPWVRSSVGTASIHLDGVFVLWVPWAWLTP
jgi:hypothetical protein